VKIGIVFEPGRKFFIGGHMISMEETLELNLT
jgi:hypothetical protein